MVNARGSGSQPIGGLARDMAGTAFAYLPEEQAAGREARDGQPVGGLARDMAGTGFAYLPEEQAATERF